MFFKKTLQLLRSLLSLSQNCYCIIDCFTPSMYMLLYKRLEQWFPNCATAPEAPQQTHRGIVGCTWEPDLPQTPRHCHLILCKMVVLWRAEIEAVTNEGPCDHGRFGNQWVREYPISSCFVHGDDAVPKWLP